MAIEVKIPSVGESITSGIVSAWHKKSGEFVNEGEALFTLETDKVSTEIVAEKAGVLETKADEGQEVKIGEVVATIDDSKAPPEEKATEKPAEKKKEPEEKKKEPEEKKKESEAEKERVEKKEKKAPLEKGEPLSPAVRRVIEEEDVEREKVSGTGKGGRLTKGDVLAAAQERKSVGEAVSVAAPPPAAEQNRPSADGRFTRKRMSPLRRKIAAQLVMAQQTAAILTTFNECDMSAVQELRAESQEKFTKKNSVKLGLMSFFIKTCVEALKAVPVVNGRIEGEDFIQNNFYDI